MTHDWIRIHTLPSADPCLAKLCEHALAEDAFQPCWIMPNEDYIISFLADASTYIGVIRMQKGEGLEDALLISAVYHVGSDDVTRLVKSLYQSCQKPASRRRIC